MYNIGEKVLLVKPYELVEVHSYSYNSKTFPENTELEITGAWHGYMYNVQTLDKQYYGYLDNRDIKPLNEVKLEIEQPINLIKRCTCGNKALGYKDYTKSHSEWCDVYKNE